jgi:hypothetical protein
MVLGKLRRSSALALAMSVLVLGTVEERDRSGCHGDSGGPSGGETTSTVPTQYVKTTTAPEYPPLTTTPQQ